MSSVPIGAFEFRITTFFLSQLHTGTNKQVVDFFIKCIVISNGLFRFPTDTFQSEQMMQAKCTQPDGAVLAVCILSLQYFNIVNINNVVEHTRLDRYETIKHSSRNCTGKVNRVQVADHEVARDLRDDDASLTVFGYELFFFNNCR
ncbi:hypothetical protein D3C81_1295660 [compost metagenome]